MSDREVLPDQGGRTIDVPRMRVELSRVANHLYREGIGDGSAAVDDALVLIDRLRAENEALKAERGWLRAGIAVMLHRSAQGQPICEYADHLLARAVDEERRASDELHGCWECGTSDMRSNVCAGHEDGRRPSREEKAT